MKKYLTRALALLCLIPVLMALPIHGESLSVSAKSAILIEADSGTVLYQKNAFTRLPMASTTKIMTALVAIESGNTDRLVKVNDAALGVEGSSIYLAKGEVLSMRNLLYALLLASANDAAAAIAYEVAGGIEGFAELMNKKADELGLTSTHFTNPHGLHDGEHYTTAYDLAMITAAALKNHVFLEICSTRAKTIPLCGGEGTRYLTNHNKLLRSYKGCIGVKTGFTKSSGRCLVSAAERDGLRLIAVTLGAPDDWRDHTAMLDFGFERYERLTLAQNGEFTATLPVAGGNVAEVIVANAKGISIFLPKNHGEITYKIEANRPLFAPVSRGAQIGRVSYYIDGEEIASSPLIAVNGVKQVQKKRSFLEWIKNLFTG